jgi:hypothetical protein
MKFIPRSFECVVYKAEKANIFLSPMDITKILSNEFLHDQHSHFIIEKDGLYNDSHDFQFGLIPDRIKQLEESYREGKSIIVKEIENWNEPMIDRCAKFGRPTNVHLYITGPQGSALSWHTDDRDVHVYMQAGTKSFETKNELGQVQQHQLEKGMGLFIPYGVEHRAIPTETGSIHLGFGVWPENLTISDSYESLGIPIDLEIATQCGGEFGLNHQAN